MIYTFRFISDEVDNFVLDINIGSKQTFGQLHKTIQKALDFDDSQLASFYTSNDDWEKEEEVPLMDMGNNEESSLMDDTSIDTYFDAKNQKLLYIFDFFEERLLFGNLVKIADGDDTSKLPVVSRLNGEIPLQTLGAMDEDDEEEYDYDEDDFPDEKDGDDYSKYDDEGDDYYGNDFADDYNSYDDRDY